MTKDTAKDSGLAPRLKPKDYKSDLRPIWCAGCGAFGVLTGLVRAFAELNIPRHEVAVITGIGCSSRLPGFLSTYGFNSLHGRAVPIAIGAKLGRPEITVVAAGGDGDMFAIGGGHLPHAARRNVDITLIVMDNRIYGLTKGQASPTTPLDDVTSSTSYGSIDTPVNMVGYMLAYGAGFVARGFAGNIKQLSAIIAEGIKHRGFSFIQILSPCVTFRGAKEYEIMRGLTKDLPGDHDPTDRKAAFDIADDTDTPYCGVIYRNSDLIPYDERIGRLRRLAEEKVAPPLDRLIDEFRP